MGVEDVDDLGKVGKRACQPVDFVDDDDFDLAGLDVGKQPLKGGTLHRPAGETAIVIEIRDCGPARVLLARDEGFAGLTLCIEGVELLLQPLVGGLAGVDCTANFDHSTRPHPI